VIPKTRTKAKEPRPITTTAIAQSGMPPTSSGAAAGAGSGLATTWKEKLESVYVRFFVLGTIQTTTKTESSLERHLINLPLQILATLKKKRLPATYSI
jgi:hypothetical protein